MTQMNGSSTPSLAMAAPQAATPYPGPVRARVAHPMLAPATIVGQYGRAWACDLGKVRSQLLKPGPDAMLAHWVIEAPWSHQVVHSYSLMLIHLRPMLGRRPVTRYVEGATHEVCLYALHPAAPRERMLRHPTDPRTWIEPMTFGAHIAAASDEAAANRVRGAVQLVVDGRLSPHPSHGRAWAQLFGDSVLRHAEVPKEESDADKHD